MGDSLRSFIGVALLIGIGYLLSTDRKSISKRMVASALATQFAIGAFVLFVPVGRDLLAGAASAVNYVLEYGNKGTEFLFGGLVSKKMFEVFGGGGFVFALRVLVIIIYVTALLAAGVNIVARYRPSRR